eukprot:Platyproteum_vivax@DN7368_c0_g2_i5.p1
MATLQTADLPSEDSADEDYEDSDSSHEVVKEKETAKDALKQRNKQLKKQHRKQEALQTFMEMKEEAEDLELSRQSREDDFMRQFHVRYPDSVKLKDVAVVEADLAKYCEKQKRHKAPLTHEGREEGEEVDVEEAVTEVNNADTVHVTEIVNFAGRQTENKRIVAKNSSEHKQVLERQKRAEKKALGGGLALVERMMQEANKPRVINSLEK